MIKESAASVQEDRPQKSKPYVTRMEDVTMYSRTLSNPSVIASKVRRMRRVWPTGLGAALLLGMLVASGTPAVAQGTWTPTGSMTAAHMGHTATRLHDGSVLVVGGLGGPDDSSVATTDRYDPKTGAWSASGTMSVPRTGHSATLLHDGRVLVAGGWDQQAGCPPCLVLLHETAEIYDPKTGAWSPTGSMATKRGAHVAVELHNGRVLVAGGGEDTLASAEVYNPKSGTWTAAAPTGVGRWDHRATLLHNGHVLVAGGVADDGSPLASAEIYDPKADAWTPTGSLSVPRYDHGAVGLHNGSVLVAGGIGVPSPPPIGFQGLSSAEIYDPKTGAWTLTVGMNSQRFGHTLTLLHNGEVLAVAGEDKDVSVIKTSERFDPKTGVWTPAADLNGLRVAHSATLLLNGRVLVAGGFFIGTLLSSAEIYEP